jgi:hypothetical protein
LWTDAHRFNFGPSKAQVGSAVMMAVQFDLGFNFYYRGFYILYATLKSAKWKTNQLEKKKPQGPSEPTVPEATGPVFK